MYHLQGDVLRNSLLTRYFGKEFIQNNNTVELASIQTAPATHGPGGE